MYEWVERGYAVGSVLLPSNYLIDTREPLWRNWSCDKGKGGFPTRQNEPRESTAREFKNETPHTHHTPQFKILNSDLHKIKFVVLVPCGKGGLSILTSQIFDHPPIIISTCIIIPRSVYHHSSNFFYTGTKCHHPLRSQSQTLACCLGVKERSIVLTSRMDLWQCLCSSK